MAQFERGGDNTGGDTNALPAAGMAAMQGVANSVSRVNMELAGYMSRRARAQMELPKQAMSCRTPAEFGVMAAQFWKDSFHDYLNLNHRLLALWTQNMTSAGQGDLARQTVEFANRFAQPMADVADETVSRVAEHPAEPWSWWRTEAPATRPSSNGHSGQSADGTRGGY